jgi:hypothetical protein
MARSGSVQAVNLRWKMLRAPDGQESPAADEFNELKARRLPVAGEATRERTTGLSSVLRDRYKEENQYRSSQAVGTPLRDERTR